MYFLLLLAYRRIFTKRRQRSWRDDWTKKTLRMARFGRAQIFKYDKRLHCVSIQSQRRLTFNFICIFL